MNSRNRCHIFTQCIQRKRKSQLSVFFLQQSMMLMHGDHMVLTTSMFAGFCRQSGAYRVGALIIGKKHPPTWLLPTAALMIDDGCDEANAADKLKH